MKTKKTSKKVINIRKDFDDIFISLFDIEIEKSVRKYIDLFEDETSIKKYHNKFMEKAKNEETKYKDYSKFKALVNSLKNIEKSAETVSEKAPIVAPKIFQEVKPVLEIEDEDFFGASNRIEALRIFEQDGDKN